MRRAYCACKVTKMERLRKAACIGLWWREYNTSIARPITHAYNIVRARVGQREGVSTKKSSFPYEKGSSFCGYWLSIQSRCFIVCFTRERLYCVSREKNRYMTINIIIIKRRKCNHFVDNVQAPPILRKNLYFWINNYIYNFFKLIKI